MPLAIDQIDELIAWSNDPQPDMAFRAVELRRRKHIIDMRRRLDRPESTRQTGAPTCIMADGPDENNEADFAFGNRRVRVAQVRASAFNGAF